MKRILALVLAAVMLVSLASCGSADNQPADNGTDTVTIADAKSLADLKGMKIGAQTGTFHLDAVDQIENVQKFDYPDFTDLLVALDSGAIDGYVAEEPTAYDVCGKDDKYAYVALKNNDTGFTATDKQTGIAVAFKTDSELVAQVNPIIATITDEQRSTLMQQMVDIGSDPEKDITAELALVSDSTDTSKGTLKIAMECAYAPFNWTQETDLNGAVEIANVQGMYANGYDVQVAKYIAAELGMKLEVYSYQWDSLIPAVQSGAVDGIAAGMSPTDERELEVDFTECYYNSNLVIIYKK